MALLPPHMLPALACKPVRFRLPQPRRRSRSPGPVRSARAAPEVAGRLSLILPRNLYLALNASERELGGRSRQEPSGSEAARPALCLVAKRAAARSDPKSTGAVRQERGTGGPPLGEGPILDVGLSDGSIAVTVEKDLLYRR